MDNITVKCEDLEETSFRVIVTGLTNQDLACKMLQIKAIIYRHGGLITYESTDMMDVNFKSKSMKQVCKSNI